MRPLIAVTFIDSCLEMCVQIFTDIHTLELSHPGQTNKQKTTIDT